ncbi:hypothetical protein, partial [Clostridioides difficile]|uniref:hypothetical protein n=1 Tax=Clostridioides difficile TaxID=1496 RepID=UPI003F8CFB3E
YWGLKILSPNIFLVASTLVCAIVSLATGSSWSTMGTVGAFTWMWWKCTYAKQISILCIYKL